MSSDTIGGDGIDNFMSRRNDVSRRRRTRQQEITTRTADNDATSRPQPETATQRQAPEAATRETDSTTTQTRTGYVAPRRDGDLFLRRGRLRFPDILSRRGRGTKNLRNAQISNHLLPQDKSKPKMCSPHTFVVSVFVCQSLWLCCSSQGKG